MSYNNNNKSSVIKSNKSPVIITHANWEPTNIRLGPKKLNVHGGASIAIISNQTNAWPSISSPPMTTWGLNEQKSMDDPNKIKYSVAHQFPSKEYPSTEADAFLAKIKAFDDKIIDLMTDNSVTYWGKPKSREVVADTFVSSLKYPGQQGAKDYSKSPTWNPKIRIYPDQQGCDDWKLEIYNQHRNRVFPNKDHISVAELLPKLSICKSLAKCNIYISGASWGITWTLEQTMIVADRINRSITGVCQFDQDDDDNEPTTTDDHNYTTIEPPTTHTPTTPPTTTYIEPTPPTNNTNNTYIHDDEEPPTTITEPIPPIVVATIFNPPTIKKRVVVKK